MPFGLRKSRWLSGLVSWQSSLAPRGGLPERCEVLCETVGRLFARNLEEVR